MIHIQQTLAAHFDLDNPPKEPTPPRPPQAWDRFARLLDWALSGPIIVWPGYHDMELPRKVKERITVERMAILAQDPTGSAKDRAASDAEAMWYLSTVSLAKPLSHEWARVFQYLTRQYLLATHQQLPDFLQQEITLERHTEYEPMLRLKRWLFRRSFEGMK